MILFGILRIFLGILWDSLGFSGIFCDSLSFLGDSMGYFGDSLRFFDTLQGAVGFFGYLKRF